MDTLRGCNFTNLKLLLLGTAEINLGNNTNITSMDEAKKQLNEKYPNTKIDVS